MQYLFRHLFFLEIDAYENVFNYGDEGDLFYIIIEGQVSIKTPFPDVLEEEQAEPYPLLVLFLTFFKDIDWKFITDGEQVRLLILDEMQKLGFRLEDDGTYEVDSGKIFKEIEHAISTEQTKLD